MSRHHSYPAYARSLSGQSRRKRRAARKTKRGIGLSIERLEHRELLSAVPVVTTGQPESVSATGAVLTGSVNPEGASTTVRFQYSTTSAFTPTAQTTIGSGFDKPGGVAVDAHGDVFITDENNFTGNEVVEEVLPNGGVRTIGSSIATPAGVAVDASGDVFFDAIDGVEEVLPAGEVKTIGSGFGEPNGVAADGSGDVFVTYNYDSADNVVEEILPNGTTQTIGSGFNQPNGVAVDASGDAFVADSGNSAIEEVFLNDSMKAIGSGFNYPVGVAVNVSGDVFVANQGSSVAEIFPDGRRRVRCGGPRPREHRSVSSAGGIPRPYAHSPLPKRVRILRAASCNGMFGPKCRKPIDYLGRAAGATGSPTPGRGGPLVCRGAKTTSER